MTHDIIKLAGEAGMSASTIHTPAMTQFLERFAQLVAASVQPKVAIAEAYRAGVDSGIAAEREACAKVCEELVIEVVGNSALAVDQCSRAIRARGQQ